MCLLEVVHYSHAASVTLRRKVLRVNFKYNNIMSPVGGICMKRDMFWEVFFSVV